MIPREVIQGRWLNIYKYFLVLQWMSTNANVCWPHLESQKLFNQTGRHADTNQTGGSWLCFSGRHLDSIWEWVLIQLVPMNLEISGESCLAVESRESTLWYELTPAGTGSNDPCHTHTKAPTSQSTSLPGRRPLRCRSPRTSKVPRNSGLNWGTSSHIYIYIYIPWESIRL